MDAWKAMLRRPVDERVGGQHSWVNAFDGTSVNVARRPALEDIDLDAAVNDEILWLRAAGERRWAQRIENANHEPDRCFKVGHYLFWLHRDTAVTSELAAVDELLYAMGYRLPAMARGHQDQP